MRVMPSLPRCPLAPPAQTIPRVAAHPSPKAWPNGQFPSFALSPATVAARSSVTLLPRCKARVARSELDMDRSQFLRLTAAAKARGATEFLQFPVRRSAVAPHKMRCDQADSPP